MFSEKILSLREAQGLKQSEFAQRIGVSVGTLSSYELGNTLPKIDIVKNICIEFNVSADWLLGLDPPPASGGDIFDLVFALRNAGAFVRPIYIQTKDFNYEDYGLERQSYILALIKGYEVTNAVKTYDQLSSLVKEGTMTPDVIDTWLSAERKRIDLNISDNSLLPGLIRHLLETTVFDLVDAIP